MAKKNTKNTVKKGAVKGTQKIPVVNVAQTIPTKEAIITEITAHYASKYPSGNIPLGKWKVGITKDIKRRKSEMLQKFGSKTLPYFKSWNTGNSNTAVSIERSFCDLGMVRCNSQMFHNDESINIYVYRLPKNQSSAKSKAVVKKRL